MITIEKIFFLLIELRKGGLSRTIQAVIILINNWKHITFKFWWLRLTKWIEKILLLINGDQEITVDCISRFRIEIVWIKIWVLYLRGEPVAQDQSFDCLDTNHDSLSYYIKAKHLFLKHFLNKINVGYFFVVESFGKHDFWMNYCCNGSPLKKVLLCLACWKNMVFIHLFQQ